MKRYSVEKESIFNFYIKRPIKAVIESIGYELQGLIYIVKRSLGYWYCDNCDTYHTPRTIKYEYSNYKYKYIKTYLCSLGLQDLEELGHKHERVKI